MSDGSTFVGVSLPPDEKSAVDEWRRHQPEIPTRPKAFANLCARRSGVMLVIGRSHNDKILFPDIWVSEA
jgi:hypothetical protein